MFYVSATHFNPRQYFKIKMPQKSLYSMFWNISECLYIFRERERHQDEKEREYKHAEEHRFSLSVYNLQI